MKFYLMNFTLEYVILLGTRLGVLNYLTTELTDGAGSTFGENPR